VTPQTLLNGMLLLVAAIPLPGLLGAVGLSPHAEFEELPSSTREYRTVTRHLRGAFNGYGTLDVLVPQFGVVALSHMASGLLNVYAAEPELQLEIRESLSEVARRALSASISPTHASTRASTPLDDHNLFWSHLGLILGIERYVRCAAKACPQTTDSDRLQERIVRHLRAKTMESASFVAPSYPGSPMWPADQTVTLLAMKLYDATNGTSLHEEPLRGFVRVLRARADPATGLFPSSVSRIANADVPRGCASSWSALYLAQLDAGMALDQYVRERDALGESILGVGGFREWPPGRGGHADVDSGPILFGVGVAASALGLGPARIFHDARSYALIRRAASAFGIPAWWPSGGYWAAPLLGEAILFNGRTARPWFGPIGTAEPRAVPLPIAPAVMTLIDVLIVILLGWRLVRTR
jgi:hypothetical protein